MEFKNIVAIVRTSVLENVEKQLRGIGVMGVSVSPVKGYGEYANFFRPDWKVTNAKVNVFAKASRADLIVSTILEAAHVGSPGDGIVAVMPVDKLYRIRTKAEVEADEV